VHTPGAGDVDQIYLLEVQQAVVEMMRSVPSGPHGLVYGYFFADELEPPAPPAPEPGPPRSNLAEDIKRMAETVERRGWQSLVRRDMDFWHEEEGSEGRYLLGLLTPERASVLRQGYLGARQALSDRGFTLGSPRMRELIEQLEHELLHACILTRADLVYAHGCFNELVGWDRVGEHGAVATPDMAHGLWQRLDALEAKHGGVDGLIEHVWREERYWRRAAVREAYEQVRDVVRGAMDRGYGFAWLLDRDW
jgi:hypothetical protein